MTPHASTSSPARLTDTQLIQKLFVFNDGDPSAETASDDDAGPSSPPRNPSKRRSPKKQRKLRCVVHTVLDEDGKEHKISSWHFMDWLYKKDPPVYPTRARGLFSEPTDDQGGHRIVARGYDKFFNINEVSWTHRFTKGPYYLTVKSNGCIILIAAISPKQLLVTSKHSIGALPDRDVSHAQRGEEWVERSLKAVGKTKEDLAARLWAEKKTAVAELCDDEFEEHVLGYSKETTGLHLHGLNHNASYLLTHPPDDVASFAKEYGFIKTDYIVKDSVDAVKRFTDECARTGKWNDTHVEGFVIRAINVRDPAPVDSLDDERLHAFMWKVKFDEPYMMWREWRETTKRMLREKNKGTPAKEGVPTAKGKPYRAKGAGAGEQLYGVNVERIRRAETRLYVRWVARAIDDPELTTLFAEYTDGRGIIAVREKYEEYLATAEGQAELAKQHEGGGEWEGPAKKDRHAPANGSSKANTETSTVSSGDAIDSLTDPLEQTTLSEKRSNLNATSVHDLANTLSSTSLHGRQTTLIVPIAIPGCGKTAMGLALEKLFGWGHTQSDDLPGKKPAAKVFIANVKKLLLDQEAGHSVVYADKNNHLAQHRDQLAKLVDECSASTQVRLVALNWNVDALGGDRVQEICSKRITQRGDRHQTLRPDGGTHEAVVYDFLKSRESFDAVLNKGDGQVHNLVNVPIELDPRPMLDHILDALVSLRVLSTPLPTSEERDEALACALAFAPELRKTMGPARGAGGKTKTQSGPRYYGIALENVDLASLLLSPRSDEDWTLPAPPAAHPHLTLVHITEIEQRQAQWDAAAALAEEKREVDVILGPKMVVVRNHVASLEARFEPVDLIEGVDGAAMHLTVAFAPKAKAVEGKAAIEAFRAGRKEMGKGKGMIVVEVGVHRIKGVIRGLH